LSPSQRAWTENAMQDHYAFEMIKYGRRRDWQTAVNLLSELSDSGVRLTATQYAAAMRACVDQCSNWETVMDLFQEMKDRGVNPNVDTYNWVMVACHRTKDYPQVLRLFEEMESRGLMPESFTQHVVFKALSRGGMWEESLHQLERLRSASDVDILTWAYTEAFRAAETKRNFQAAFDIEGMAAEDGVEINDFQVEKTGFERLHPKVKRGHRDLQGLELARAVLYEVPRKILDDPLGPIDVAGYR